MCGVAGVWHYRRPERPASRLVVQAMTRALAHRGPDGEGLHFDGGLGLGHRRLAIVDLTPTGAQPMATADGHAVISYNGECYNHAQLRTRLEQRGVRFRGSSDSETLLEGLRAYGASLLPELLGIFAFAYWDARRRRLLLCRDPLGVKQLYYHDDGSRIAFASEIKALLEVPGVPAELDPVAVNEYLHFHTPLFERTFFKGIRQLRQGEYVLVDESGPAARSYWQPDGFEPRPERPQDQVAQLRELLTTVVRDQLMSDVPVGAFFSGGIDSSAIVAAARRAGRRLRCFGVHFSGQGVVDERPYQEQAAAALGVPLELLTLDGASFPEDFTRLIEQQDSPVIGAAMLPMYHVSKLAARAVKVCLGGQAGDEIFGGYARYALVRPSAVLRNALAFGAGGGNGRASAGGPARGSLLKQALAAGNPRRLTRVLRHGRDWRRRYFDHFTKVDAARWRSVLAAPELFAPEQAFQVFRDTLEASPAPDAEHKVLHWDVQTYLPGLFQQDDRMSMAHSLESRVPLADPRLVRFAFHTPFALKMRAGSSKWILRQAVAPELPESVLNRRKVGFDTPAPRWMQGRHAGFVRDVLLSAQARERGLFATRAVEAVLADTGSPHWFDVVWKLLAIETWAVAFLDRSTTGAAVAHAAS